MPFLDTNSHLTIKPYNLDIKCQSNSESYDQHGFFGTKLRGGQKFLLMVGGFFNEREYSGADWLVPFITKTTLIESYKSFGGISLGLEYDLYQIN